MRSRARRSYFFGEGEGEAEPDSPASSSSLPAFFLDFFEVDFSAVAPPPIFKVLISSVPSSCFQ